MRYKWKLYYIASTYASMRMVHTPFLFSQLSWNANVVTRAPPAFLAMEWGFFAFFFFKDFIYLFPERGEVGEEERERNINVWLPRVHSQLGTWPATQACALTGNRTGDTLLHRQCSIHWATPAREWVLACKPHSVEQRDRKSLTP